MRIVFIPGAVLLMLGCPGALPPRQGDLALSKDTLASDWPRAATDTASNDLALADLRGADGARDLRGDLPRPDAKTSGTKQTCTTASCVLSCPLGHCDQNCAAATTCVGQCNPGGCQTACAASKTCVVYCSTGGCTVDCSAAVCAVYCNGGGCTVDCTKAAACNVACPTKNCTVIK